eukprot:TRINITY_DN59740_c0_g1_i1.p1 TRINITY_DN59740_c0_g1~~TRINITY_DN59740_c0_g1_i1.p1  ORF type:complete len:429 (+),score=71.92 TRINITY_DN59740_c0_g1_i1:83-1369(+)
MVNLGSSSLALAAALRRGRLLVALAKEKDSGSCFLAWPRDLASACLSAGARESEPQDFLTLLGALVGQKRASELLSDMAADRSGGRALTLWPVDAPARALELRVLPCWGREGDKGARPQRFIALCADVAHSQAGCSRAPLTLPESLQLREQIDQAHAALAELLGAMAHNSTPAGLPERWPSRKEFSMSSLRFRAQLLDQEAFSSCSMAAAQLPAALVSLVLPSSHKGLAPGVYFSKWREDVGVLLAVSRSDLSSGAVQQVAELCFFHRDAARTGTAPDLLDVDDELPSRGCAGEMREVNRLRPFYHGLTAGSGGHKAFGDGGQELKRQVGLDVLAAVQRLWPVTLKSESRTEIAAPMPSLTQASMPGHLLNGELLASTAWLDLPIWAVTSRESYGAALPAARAALVVEALSGRPDGYSSAILDEVMCS